VQSLEDAELAAVGRRHDAAGARRALDRLVGWELSVSADLILGLPEQTAASFRRSVEEIGASGVDHLSIYLLETEKSRSIEEDRRARPDRYLSDDEQADAWLEAGETLAARGFLHYEISNWARNGRQARHNVKYWTRTPTLGLGVSAHELWGERRRANVSAIPPYVAALSDGRRPLALDQPVGEAEAARERIVLGLRLSEGVPAGEIEAWIESEGDALLAGDYRTWFDAGLLSRENGRVRFTERGFLLSNEVLCRFV
jgi:oxygen-independent coproporphyrinogen-3 oxidase